MLDGGSWMMKVKRGINVLYTLYAHEHREIPCTAHLESQ